MPRPKKTSCQVCNISESKYTCSKCMVLYCSVPCYKRHQESSCAPKSSPSISTTISVLDQEPAELLRPPPEAPNTDADSGAEAPVDPDRPPSPPLRPLTSLRWPYVPEESAYPDPLKRDDPKPLQLPQYEAIATSTAIRESLASNPWLPELLKSLDKLRGEAREDALERALGVSMYDTQTQTLHTSGGHHGNVVAGMTMTEDDVQTLRRLAEAVEAAVRGGKEDVLGLNWGDR